MTTTTEGDWTIDDGTARACVYLTGPKGEPWIPRDDAQDQMGARPEWSPTIAQIMRMKAVECVDSCGAQGYHIEIVADTIQELPAAVAHVKQCVARLFEAGKRRHVAAPEVPAHV